MTGFIDILKIVLKVAFVPIALIVLFNILDLAITDDGVANFVNGGLDLAYSVGNFMYRVFYFWTGGLFVYPFAIILMALALRVSMTTAYALIWSYKWYLKVLE